MSLLHEYSTLRQWYKLHDSPTDERRNLGSLPIRPAEASKAQGEGFGVFWTNNVFIGQRRKSDINRVLSWAIDIDEGTKEQQRERIKKFLVPSCIIESKNGYHCYWYTDDQEPDGDSYRSFIEDYFLENLMGDPKAKDIARILRVPYTKHLKDPNDPFTIEVAYDSNKKYDKRTIIKHFPQSKKKQQQIKVREKMRSILSTDSDKDLFSKIYDMDHMAALQRLSGTDYVQGETFTFKPTTRGNYNIWVNNKSTSCFIDSDNKIGSSEGGPTIWQWLKYYGHSDKKIYQIMKETFKELFNDK